MEPRAGLLAPLWRLRGTVGLLGVDGRLVLSAAALDLLSCLCATTRPACHPGARPRLGGRIDSASSALRAITQAITEFEFHISPAPS
jgi:hypothetical protein